jgi:hypothetical protein
VDGLTLEKADMLRQIQVRQLGTMICRSHVRHYWLVGVCNTHTSL